MHNADHLLKALGDELRFRRAEIGFSQEELAYRAGVNRTYVAKLELAKNQPTLQILYKLAIALEVDLPVFIQSLLQRAGRIGNTNPARPAPPREGDRVGKDT